MNAPEKIETFTKFTSDAALDVIESIASVSGKAKEELLASYLPNSNLMIYLKAALDPFITYGVKKIASTETGSREFTEDTFRLLDSLAGRAITGNAALALISAELQSLTPKSGDLLRRIITKDLRAGFSAKSVNRVMPGSIFIFECMLSHKFEEKRIKSFPIVGEIKLDGVRAIAIYKEGEVKFYSRVGNEFTNYKAAAEQLAELVAETWPAIEAHLGEGSSKSLVFDGELMSGSGAFNDTAGEIHRKDQQVDNATYNIFELMTDFEFNEGSNRTYRLRRALLQKIMNCSGHRNLLITSAWAFNSVDEIYSRQNEILASGGEGLIIKPLDGTYENKRSYNWLKIKDCQSVDLQIVGFEPGTGKLEGRLGAFIVDFNGVEVNVGSGLTDELRVELEKCEGLYKGRLIEVQYHEITPDKSLRHPRFIRFRDDKPVEDGAGA